MRGGLIRTKRRRSRGGPGMPEPANIILSAQCSGLEFGKHGFKRPSLLPPKIIVNIGEIDELSSLVTDGFAKRKEMHST